LVARLRKGRYRLIPEISSTSVTAYQSSENGLLVVDELRLVDHIEILRQRGIPACVGERTASHIWTLPLWGVTKQAHPILMVPRGTGLRRDPVGGVRIVERTIAPRHIVHLPLRAGLPAVPTVDPLLAGLQVAARSELTLASRLSILNAALRRQLQWSENLPPDDDRELAHQFAEPRMCRALLDQARVRAEHMDTRGRQTLMEAISRADPRIETVLESISWAYFIECGMALPAPQAVVRGVSRREWRVDFLFSHGVIGECDGAGKYADPQALWNEKKRQHDLEMAGFVVVRWTWEEIVYRPEVVRDRITSAIARASRWRGVGS